MFHTLFLKCIVYFKSTPWFYKSLEDPAVVCRDAITNLCSAVPPCPGLTRHSGFPPRILRKGQAGKLTTSTLTLSGKTLKNIYSQTEEKVTFNHCCHGNEDQYLPLLSSYTWHTAETPHTLPLFLFSSKEVFDKSPHGDKDTRFGHLMFACQERGKGGRRAGKK